MAETQIRALENADTPAFLRQVVVYDTEENYESVFVLSSGPGGRRDGCTLVNRDAAFGHVLATCVVGDETDFGIVVSVDGSPVLCKAERDEILRVRSEQAKERRRAAEERRRAAEEKARIAAVAAEQRRILLAEAEAERLKEEKEAAAQWRIVVAEAKKEAAEAAKQRQLNEAKTAQSEERAAEKSRIVEAEAALREAERVKLEKAKAAERNAIRRQQEAEKRERDRLEAHEQKLRRIAWLEDQRTKAEAAPLLSLEEARSEVSKLKALGRSAVLDGIAVSDRAEILYIRCRKGYDVASDTQRTADSGVTALGGFVGFLIGALAGPVGAAVGAGVGAGWGRLQKAGSEKGDWAELLSALNVLATRPL